MTSEMEYITVSEFAEIFQLQPGYVYKLIHQKKIKHYKPFGKRVYFLKADIEALMNASVVEVDCTDERIKEAADRYMLNRK